MSEANQSLSILHLMLEASFIVQMVMLILFLASVISWVMIFQRQVYQRKAAAALFILRNSSGLESI